MDKKTLAIIGLILNILLIPGIGTLVTKRFGKGVIQLILALIGLVTTIIFIGVIIYLAVWIWALIDSILYLVSVIKEEELNNTNNAQSNDKKEETSKENKEKETETN